MAEGFYTTKQAAKIVGCTIRQIQYWRKQEVVVPQINPSGTGHSVYYSREDLTDLAIVHYLLQRGYSFQSAGDVLGKLKEIDPRYNVPENGQRYLLKWDTDTEVLTVTPFSSDRLQDDIADGVVSVTALSLDLLQMEIEAGLGNRPRRKRKRQHVTPIGDKAMNEADTCREYVLPKLRQAGWEQKPYSITEQRTFTDGRIITFSNQVKRGKQKQADYILQYRRNFPIAVVEAKPNEKSPAEGLQQAKEYAEILGLKFAYATNGSGIVEFDFTTGRELELSSFPTPDTLWARYCQSEGLNLGQEETLLAAYNLQSGKKPRYYQEIAINRAVQGILQGKKRLLLTMATGTGKTTTAFQICWKLWASQWNREGSCRRPKILFLSDRSMLVDDPMKKDYAPFGDALYKIQGGKTVQSRDIYFATYQAILGISATRCAEDEQRLGVYRDFPPDFFDLIIIDECHRGSANSDSFWREILTYFYPAVQLGLTAIPLRDESRNTYEYFGNSLYTYSLRQGIEDGFLAPYRVHRVITSADARGWRPPSGELDRFEREVPDEEYQTSNFEQVVVLRSETEAIAKHLTDFLKKTDRFAKTLVFCVDQETALEMKTALNNLNSDLVHKYPNYVCQVTSNEWEVGRGHLEQFQDVETDTPVILTTSQLLTTGIDLPTTKNIVLARGVTSLAEFKQILGRGTQVREEYGKLFFNILDYTGTVTEHFADPEFDGDPAFIEEETIAHDGIVVTTEVVQEETDTDPTAEEVNPPRRSRGLHPTPEVAEPRKYYFDGGTVEIVHELVYELDAQSNRLRCVEYADYTGEEVRKICPDTEALRATWRNTGQRELLMAQLEERGINVIALESTMGFLEVDPFDLLCHLAFHTTLLTRRERAERVRKNQTDLFSEYGTEARAILEDLLDKYAEYGPTQLKIPDVLKVPPISQRGNISEIIKLFNGADRLRKAVDQLQDFLYAA
ncbi:MAG: DEAD/DEAH box helicase family protein [Snowella sp.]|nr:DEAD/DEAH box helicase family protein [Snowella sp.]